MPPAPARAEVPIDFHVIGFGVEDDVRTTLEEMAAAGGGHYHPAANEDELVDALTEAAGSRRARPGTPAATPWRSRSTLDGSPRGAPTVPWGARAGPETDASPSPAGTTGRMVEFEGGTAVLHGGGDRDGRVFVIDGCVREVHAAEGGTSSWLGFPTSDVFRDPRGSPGRLRGRVGDPDRTAVPGRPAGRGGPLRGGWPNRGGIRCSGLVLAAGTSSRMGRPKTLLPFRGRPLLEHVLVEAARSSLDDLVLGPGRESEEVSREVALPDGPPVRVVVNPEPERGQASSLALGIEAVDPRADAVCVLLCDQPGVDAPLIDRIVEHYSLHVPVADRPTRLSGRGRSGRGGAAGPRAPGDPRSIDPPRGAPARGKTRAHGASCARTRTGSDVVPVAGQPPGDADTPEEWARLVDARRPLS